MSQPPIQDVGLAEVRFALVPADYAAFFRHCVNSSRRVVWTRRFNVVLILAVGFVPFLINTLIYADSPVEDIQSGYQGFVWLAIAVVLPLQIWQWWTYPERLVKKTIKDGKARNWFDPQRIQLASQSIEYACASGTTFLQWHAVWTIDELESHFVLRVGPEDGIIVPHRAFPDDATREAFISMAHRFRREAPSALEKCPMCSYDLRKSVVDGCPECGWRRDAAGG